MVVPSRATLDSSLLFLALIGCIVALLTLRAVRGPHRIARRDPDEYLEIAGTVAAATLLTLPFARRFAELVPALALFLATTAGFCFLARRLSMPGILWMAAQVSTLVVSALWAAAFVLETTLPGALKTLALAGIGASAVMAAIGLIESFARESLLTHEVWRLPIDPLAAAARRNCRKVSLHLPCYAEPPGVVRATMDRLAALAYDNYEVLVCDNNTQDERLWRPLEAHCAALNRKLGREVFRFFHVAALPGAKAGALNYLLPRMAPDAEIVGVIDADYLSRPDFLSRLVPYFDDPGIGYVQTPHDYRDYEGSSYLSACYWEYMPANKIDWPGVSEYGGAFTIGTMCLLRAEALRSVGGWAEWCLTEDSEISVRLRAAGYRGFYFVETFGRGLIPDTFADYKKQRFRWTAGPVQQLVRHWRLFLPAPFAPAMPGWTKLLEVTRCMAPLMRLGGVVLGLAGIAGMALARWAGTIAPVDVPDVVWILLGLGTLTWGVRTVHRYRLAGCRAPIDMIRGEIARAALTWVVLLAGIAGLSSRPLAWRRTPKFAVASLDSALTAALPETLLGLTCTALAVAAATRADFWGGEVAALIALGLGGLALCFLCAPLMAVLARTHARRMLGQASAAAMVGEPRAIPAACP